MPAFLLMAVKSLAFGAITALVKILLKVLTKGVAEEHLSKLFFYLADWFAKQTATTADDQLVQWAKSVYSTEEELKLDVASVQVPDFITKERQHG